MTGSLVAARGAAPDVATDAPDAPTDAAGATPGAAAASVDASAPRAATDAEAIETAAAPPLLTVSGLSISYGRLRALDNINLSVRSGELVALAGENGAGKTSLVRCIAGDVVPATGEIFLAGRRVPSARARPGRPSTGSPWSGRTWRCATTWTSRPTSCSAGSRRG